VKRRTLLGIVIAVVVLVALALILVYLPVEATGFAEASDTSACSGGGTPCGHDAAEFTLGDHRFATFSGTWMSNSTVGDIVVTVNNGPSDEPCLVCNGLLYSSLLSIFPSGSFDVSGFGPFHVSVNQVGSSAATTTVQGTVDSAVL
jgi:hypothetical protein